MGAICAQVDSTGSSWHCRGRKPATDRTPCAISGPDFRLPVASLASLAVHRSTREARARLSRAMRTITCFFQFRQFHIAKAMSEMDPIYLFIEPNLRCGHAPVLNTPYTRLFKTMRQHVAIPSPITGGNPVAYIVTSGLQWTRQTTADDHPCCIWWSVV